MDVNEIGSWNEGIWLPQTWPFLGDMHLTKLGVTRQVTERHVDPSVLPCKDEVTVF